MTTAIIYSHANYQAVIAAAILKVEFPTALACDLRGEIPMDADRYIWLGMDPITRRNPWGSAQHVRPPQKAGVSHIVFNRGSVNCIGYSWSYDQYMLADKNKNREPVLKFANEEVYQKVVEDYYHHVSSMLEQVLDVFKLDSLLYRRLAFHAGKFEQRIVDKDLRSEIVTLYINILAAEEALFSNEPYKFVEPLAQHWIQYDTSVKRAKKALNGRFYLTKHFDGTVLRKVAVLSVGEGDIHVALRLVKMTHQHFIVNYTGINGPVIYTNLQDRNSFANKDYALVVS